MTKTFYILAEKEQGSMAEWFPIVTTGCMGDAYREFMTRPGPVAYICGIADENLREIIGEAMQSLRQVNEMNKVWLFRKIAEEASALYAKKNADYGDSFGKTYAEYGAVMPLIRLEDKLGRLKKLTLGKEAQQVNDESIDDTLMDIVCYAVMTLIERRINSEEGWI